MTLAHRWKRAEALDGSPWMRGVAIAIAAVLTDVVLTWIPRTGSDLERARALGIVSRTILAGYPKSFDTRAYVFGLIVFVGASLGLWLLWATVAGRGALPAARDTEETPCAPPSPATRLTWREWALLGSLLALGLLKMDMARNGWFGSWALLSEEGEMLSWIDTVLRGGVLYRDVFCLYGPLAKLPVVWLFEVFGPSVRLWRLWIYVADLIALLGVHVLMRTVMRRRPVAVCGTVLVGLLCTSSVPAMGWSLSRVACGLVTLAALGKSLQRKSHSLMTLTGGLLGLTLFYSSEVGLAAGMAIVATLAFQGRWSGTPIGAQARRLGCLAGGFLLAALPIAGYFAWEGALGAMIDNSFLFPRTKLLGFGGYAFPSFAAALTGVAGRAAPPGWEGPFAAVGCYVTPAVVAVGAHLLLGRVLLGRVSERLVLQLAILLFGAVLFQSALARPDVTHVIFALPPSLVLLVSLLEDSALAASGERSGRARRILAGVSLLLALLGLGTFREVIGQNLRDFGRQAILTVSGRFWRREVPGMKTLDLPRAGGIGVLEDAAPVIEDAVKYVQSRTGRDEPIWAFPNEALFNFLADRPLANPFPLGAFAITTQQRLEMIAALERSRPEYAIVYGRTAMVDGIPYNVALPEPAAYLKDHYALDRQFGVIYVLRRR